MLTSTIIIVVDNENYGYHYRYITYHIGYRASDYVCKPAITII